MRAYLELLASGEPLSHPTPAAPDHAAAAYLALLASDAPLTPADLLPEVAVTVAAPRRRSSHRAARTIVLGARGRNAVMAAALLAGVGVAGVAVAATATPSRADSIIGGDPRAVAQTSTDPIGEHVGTAAANLVKEDPAYYDAEDHPSTPPPALSFARVARKVRPVPVAQWVNPLPEASVTSCFGQRWGRLHAGVDLAAPEGTRIRAAGAGVVVAADEEGGYGNAVLIDHGNGFLTHYGHMLAIGVTVGQHVKAGETIGQEGSTGHSTGPHLHFEVHQGSYKNPIEPTAWMRAHGVDIPGCSADAEPADDHDHDHED